MLKKSSFGIVFNTVFSIVFAAAITLFVKWSQEILTFETFITGVIPAFSFSFTLGVYIPILPIGNGFARLFIKNEKNPLFYFLRMLAIVFIMTAAMSFLMMFSEMGFKKEFLSAFIFSFPSVFLYAYVVACVVFPFLLKFTEYVCVKE